MITTWYWILGVLVCFRETIATLVPVNMLSNPLCRGFECQPQLLYQPVYRVARSHYNFDQHQLTPQLLPPHNQQQESKCPLAYNTDLQNYHHLNEQKSQGLHTQVQYQAQYDTQNDHRQSTYQNNGYLPPYETHKKIEPNYQLSQHQDLTKYHQALNQYHGQITQNYDLTQNYQNQHHGKIAHTVKYDVYHHHPSHHAQSGAKSSTNIEQHHDLHHDYHEDDHDHHDKSHKKKNAYYKFDYSVNDHHTGDIKHHEEERKEDEVRGEYSLVEKDGNVRTVKYFADWKTGFHATVHNSKNRS